MATFLKAFCLALGLIAAPSIAYADPGNLFQIAATVITGALGTIPGVGPILSAAFSIGFGLLGQALFGQQDTGKQRGGRTREFDPHPPFRFAFGEFPLEGSVVFHHVAKDKYYLTILLNSLPSKEVNKIFIQEHTDLNVVEDIGANLYDMTADDNNPTVSEVWNEDDIKIWIGLGDHTQCPQVFLDEIGPSGSIDPGVLQTTDIWKGATVAFIRLTDGNPGLQAKRFAYGKPPPLRFHGKWSKLYDPRKDPNSGVTQYTSGSHDPDDRTTWEYSSNPALCGLMLAMHSFALGFDREMIPIQQWADAADDCGDGTPAIDPTFTNVEFLAELNEDTTSDDKNGWDLDSASGGWPDLADATTTLFGQPMAEFVDGGDLSEIDVGFARGSKDFFLFDDGDGVFEGHIRPATGAYSTPRTILSQYRGSDSQERWELKIDDDSGTWTSLPNSLFYFVCTPGAAGVPVPGDAQLIVAGPAITKGATQHFAFQRSGDDHVIFVAGVPGNVETSTVRPSSTASDRELWPGQTFTGANWRHQYVGHMAEFRFTLNEAFYPEAGFDPPTAPFPRSETGSNGGGAIFRCDGVVAIDDREVSMLEPVLDTMAGHLDTTDGLLGVRAGVWKAPTVTLSQPVGDELSVDGARDAGFDTVRAKFLWEGKEFEESDGPGWQLRAGSRVRPLQLPLVKGREQAARLEKINALRAEPNRSVTATFDGREANRRIGERVSFSLPGFGRAAGTFVVTSKTLHTREVDDGFEFATALTLVEDLETTYDWSDADYTPIDDQTNSGPTTAAFDAPSVLLTQSNFYDGADVVPRLKVTVTLNADTAGEANTIPVEVNDGSGWRIFLTMNGDGSTTTFTAFVNPVTVGLTYTARARVVSEALGTTPWGNSNSVVVTAALGDYSHDDYSGEYV